MCIVLALAPPLAPTALSQLGPGGRLRGALARLHTDQLVRQLHETAQLAAARLEGAHAHQPARREPRGRATLPSWTAAPRAPLAPPPARYQGRSTDARSGPHATMMPHAYRMARVRGRAADACNGEPCAPLPCTFEVTLPLRCHARVVRHSWRAAEAPQCTTSIVC